MSRYDPLLEQLLTQPLANDTLLKQLLGAPLPEPVALTVARRPAATRRAQTRLISAAGTLLLAGTLVFGGVAPTYASERAQDAPAAPPAAPPAVPAAVAAYAGVDEALAGAPVLPALQPAAPASASAALPPAVSSALVQRFEPLAALPAPEPSAAQTAPEPLVTPAGATGGASAFPPANVRLPLEQKVPPAAPGPVQAVAVPPAPAAPRQPQVIVRERVRVVYVVVPPPDFSDPFVHIRGTNFDPRVLAAGGPFPTRTIVQPVRVVTRPAPSAQPAPQPARTYIVRTGDTLTGIALRFYGNSELWTTIFNANRRVVGSDPNEVIPGTRLVIP